MIVYLLLYIFMIILLCFSKKTNVNRLSFLLVVTMIVIAGIRNGIGTDYNMYKSFYFFPNQPSANKVEWGFIKLIEVTKNIFNEKYYLFFLLCSTITLIPIFYIFKKKSKQPVFSLLLFTCLGFYTLSFNLIRQSIAISLVFYALKYIEEQNKSKYFITIIIAASFHITALIALPLYYFSKSNIEKNKLKAFFLILLFAGMSFNPIFNYVVTNIPQYMIYKNYSNTIAGIGTYLVGLIYLVMIWLSIIKKEQFVKNNFDNICLNTSIIAVPMVVLSFKNILFARMIYYFFIPLLVPFTNIIYIFNIKKTQKIFNIFLALALLIIYVLNIINFNEVLPYISIFD